MMATFANAGFETPNQGAPNLNWEQANGTGSGSLAGASWVFVDGAGISRNGSAFGHPLAPEGQQVALLQQAPTVAQARLTQAGSAFIIGNAYSITISAVSRDGNFNDINMTIDGQPIMGGLINFTGAWQDVTSATFVATSTTPTLSIFTTNPFGGDRTTFIDNVRINDLGVPATPTISNPGFETGPFGVFPNYQVVDGWASNTDNSGSNAAGGPFLNGLAPAVGARSGLIQSGTNAGLPLVGTLSQTITGLTPGRKYQVSFLENERGQAGGDFSKVTVLVNGSTVLAEHNVGRTAAFVSKTTQIFTATGTSATLTVESRPGTADTTLLLDAFSISAVPSLLDDSYVATEDVPLTVPTATGVLANDRLGYRIGTNVAPLGVAQHNSECCGGAPQRAIDGNTDGNYGNGSVSHTAGSAPGDWWQVALASTTSVSQIRLFNRTDCCADRLSNFRVSLWNGNPNTVGSTEVWGQNYFPTGQMPTMLTIGPNDQSSTGAPLGGLSGNYVRVQLIGQNNLSLAEVQVFAAIPTLEVGTVQAATVTGTQGTLGDGSATAAATGGGSVTVADTGGFTYNQAGAFNGLDTGETGVASFTYNVALPPGSVQINLESSNGVFNVASNDLINGKTPTLTGTTLGGYEGTSSNPLTVTNGNFGPTGHGNLGDELTIGNNAGAGPGTTFTYALDLAASPQGYALTEADVYSAWSDGGRDNQRYTLLYSTVANPTVYNTLATIGDFAPTLGSNLKSSITSTNGILAVNVANVRFFFPDPQENNYAGYRELDVFGFPMPTAVTATITVSGVNDAPTGSVAPVTITEGDDLVLAATGNDVDVEPLTFSWDLNNDGIFGDATGATPTIPWATLQGLAPPVNDSGVRNATLRISDGTANTNVAFTFTVNNANPTAFVAGPSEVGIGQATTFTFSATDPSDADTAAGFDYTINWGDGNTETHNDVVGDLVLTHVFDTESNFTIEVTATDKDGGVSDVATAGISVSPVLIDEAGNLIVAGSNTMNDQISFTAASGGRINVRVVAGGVITNYGAFTLGSEGRIIALGRGGDDNITNTTTFPVSFDGGAGNDYLSGGSNSDTLVGGQGNDRILGGIGNDYMDGGTENDSMDGGAGNDSMFGGSGIDTVNGGAGNDLMDGGDDNDTMNGGTENDILFGGGGNDNLNGSTGNDVVVGGDGTDSLLGDTGRDILLGGAGKDTVSGGADDDVIAGGLTSYDAYSASNALALQLLMTEWSGVNAYATRISNLKSGGGATGGNRLNPGAALGGAVTVVNNDGFAETLKGDAGSDWFLATTTDLVDKLATETLN